MNQTVNSPKGQLLLRTLAMPADTNANGDIFGGWIMSQLDLAGGILAKEISCGRIVTVSVSSITFKNLSKSVTWYVATANAPRLAAHRCRSISKCGLSQSKKRGSANVFKCVKPPLTMWRLMQMAAQSNKPQQWITEIILIGCVSRASCVEY